MTTVKISSKNQITIPKALLDALHLKGGSRVIIESRKDGVLIRPRKGSITDEYYGYAKTAWRKLGGGEKHLKKERDSWR